MKLRVLYPFRCNDDHTCHPPFSMVRYLSMTDLEAELWVLRRGPRARRPFVRAPLPGKALGLVERARRALKLGPGWGTALLERRYLGQFRPGDAAHVYRGCSLDLLRTLRARGHVIFLERVNTMDHVARRTIEDAIARTGWPVEHSYTQAVLDREQAQVDTAHFIFSPSPLVTDSLRERGVPEKRILSTSYGWEPVRFQTTRRALPEIAGLTVLFLGRVGIRKGAHLLLSAWSRAGIKGRLVLAGPMDPEITRHCGPHLGRGDVIHLDYDPDPAPVYRSADIFAFPTLEEGSPLVSYEAMGNGLPIVTSPMGAGSVIRHQQEGLVVDPHDQEALVEALRELAGDAERRRVMGAAGRLRAADYTWDKVAARRYELIKGALSR